MHLEYLIAYASFGSVLIPITLAVIQWKGLNKVLKSLSVVLLCSLASDAISVILIQYSINTYPLLNTFLIIQFSLLAWIFRMHMTKRNLVDVTILLFLMFACVNLTFFQGLWVFNSISNVVACLVLMVFCLHYFYRLLEELPIVHVQHLPMFWIGFAVLTYYAGNFFLFLFNNYLVNDATGPHRLMWILHNLLNIVKNVLFSIALWLSYRKARSSFSSPSAP